MRVIGDDRQQGYLLMDYVIRKMTTSASASSAAATAMGVLVCAR